MEFLGLENDKKSLFTEMKLFLKKKQTFSFGQRRPLKNRLNDISINSENLNLIEKTQNQNLPPDLKFYTTLKTTRTAFKAGIDRIKTIAKKRLKYTFGCPKHLDKEMSLALENNYNIIKKYKHQITNISNSKKRLLSSKLTNAIKSHQLQKLKKMLKKLKKQETDFYNKLKGLDKNLSSFDFINQDENQHNEKIVYDENGEKMVLRDISKKEENSDLVKMVEKIESLTSMLREMRDLTMEQGVVVDRIDYNIEVTGQRTRKANEELVAVKEEMEKGCAAKLLRFLVVANCVLFLLILMRNWV